VYAMQLENKQETNRYRIGGKRDAAYCVSFLYNNYMNFPIDIHDKHQKIAKKIGFDPADVEEHFTRGSGHGGQNINKSTNCVELNHEPTGTNVRYHHHRGLQQNRKEAWELLILKVQERVEGDESELSKKKHKIQKQKQRRSRRSKEKMLDEKKQRSEIKEARKKIT
jgi:protein subunit release factor B